MICGVSSSNIAMTVNKFYIQNIEIQKHSQVNIYYFTNV